MSFLNHGKCVFLGKKYNQAFKKLGLHYYKWKFTFRWHKSLWHSNKRCSVFVFKFLILNRGSLAYSVALSPSLHNINKRHTPPKGFFLLQLWYIELWHFIYTNATPISKCRENKEQHCFLLFVAPGSLSLYYSFIASNGTQASLVKKKVERKLLGKVGDVSWTPKPISELVSQEGLESRF